MLSKVGTRGLRMHAAAVAAGCLAACGEAPRDTEPRLGPHAVVGTVVDAAGRPDFFARVRVGTTLAVTNLDGEFTVDDVPDVYDLVVKGSLDHIHVFEGLTSRHPAITLPGLPQGPEHGTIAVTLPAQADTQVWLTAQVPQRGNRPFGLQSVYTLPPSSSMVKNLEIDWSGDEPADVTLAALRFDYDQGREVDFSFSTDDTRTWFRPRRFLAVALDDIPLPPAGTAEWIPNFKPAENRTLQVVANTPEDALTTHHWLYVRLRPELQLAGLNDASPGNPAFLLAPRLEGAEMLLKTRTVFSAAEEAGEELGECMTTTTVTDGSDTVNVAVGTPPVLEAPGIGARVSAGAEFRSAVEGLHAFRLWSDRIVVLEVHTAHASIALPDLRDLDFRLDSRLAQSWSIVRYSDDLPLESLAAPPWLSTGERCESAIRPVTFIE